VASAYEDPETDVVKGGVSNFCSQTAFQIRGKPVCRQLSTPRDSVKKI